MKILFVSAILPFPLSSGGQVRIYNLLRRVSESHQITLFSFIRKKEEKKYIKELSFLTKIKLIYRGHRLNPKYLTRFAFSTNSLLSSSYNNQTMKRELASEIKTGNYDLLHLEPFYVYPSIPETDLPKVICEHNVEFQVYQDFADRFFISLIKPVLFNEADRIRKEETQALNASDHIIAVSRKDQDYIHKNISQKNISVVENGVDIDFFRFTKRKKYIKPLSFLFLGNFLWIPNIDGVNYLINKLWPRIILKYPDSKLTIVGKKLPGNIEKRIKHDLSVAYKPWVDDIRKEYYNADALLSPMKVAGGSKYKIIEAMATGCPIIASPESVYGTCAKHQVHALLSQNDQDYVNYCQVLLNRPQIINAMTVRARKLIEKDYNWDNLAKKLINVWENV